MIVFFVHRIGPSLGRATLACITRALMSLAILSLAILSLPADVFGQGAIQLRSRSESCRFVEAPRWLSQQISDAEDSIEQRQYADAIVRLGDLLARDDVNADGALLAGQDYFLSIDDTVESQRLSESVLKKCREMIGEMPEAALQTYELRYGPLATRQLKEASKNRDWHGLRAVRRQYFHTSAGYEASYLLAAHEMATGHPLAASFLLDDVVKTERARQHLGESLLVLHAAACRLSGRRLPSTELPSGETNITIAGAEKRMPQRNELGKWIDQHYQVSLGRAGGESGDYKVQGSSTSRNETKAGQLPLSNPRWMVETTATAKEDQLISQRYERLVAGGKLPPPTWTPLRVGNQILMRATDRLRGIDHRTGKRVWEYPWFTTSDTPEEEETVEDLAGAQEDPSDLLIQRVWNDVPYGQITSDGQRVFMLHDLSRVQSVVISPLMGIRASMPRSSLGNTLVALELATEGKLLWRLGQGDAQGSPLSDAFFLGAPLPLDGRLYAIVEMSGDISLACIDPQSGELLWLQQLVAIDALGIEYDAVRRIAGATPSFHEGVLICPTGAGATVAVDLGDQMLRWGRSYPRKPTVTRNFSRPQPPDAEQLMQRWNNGIAIADGQDVVLTPTETEQLFCVELMSGKLRFNPRPRESLFYVAGIRDGLAIVVGANDVKAIDLETGNERWHTEEDLFSAGQQIVGRGVFGDDTYIVPVAGNHLFQISLENGELIQKRATRYPLGNLIAVDGEIVSQGPTMLSVAHGEQALAESVALRLGKTPDDFEALIQKAELLIQRDQRGEALQLLETAGELNPESDEVLMLSISAMLGMMRANPDQPSDVLDKLDQMIDSPTQRLEYLALLINRSIAENEPVKAASQLIDFSSVVISERMLTGVPQDLLGDPARQVALNSWVAARAAKIRELAVQADRLEEVRFLVGRYLENKALGTDNLLRGLLRHFSPIGAEELRDKLAQHYLSEEDYLRAERTAIGSRPTSELHLQLSNPESDLDAELAILLAEIYARGRFGGDSLKWLSRAESLRSERQERWSEIEALGKGSQEQNADFLDLSADVTLQWSSQRMSGSSINQLNTPDVAGAKHLYGETFRGWNVISDATSVWTQNPLGEPRRLSIQRMATRSYRGYQVAMNGGVMLMVRQGDVTAVDLFKLRSPPRGDLVLWQRTFGSGSLAPKRRSGTSPFGDLIEKNVIGTLGHEFYVGPMLGDRVIVLQGGELMAIDLLNEETLWRNSDAPIGGVVLCDGEKIAVVRHFEMKPRLETEVAYFNVHDGEKISSKAWEHGAIWASAGKHVLCYSNTDDQSTRRVSLVDAFSGQVVLETESPIRRPPKTDAPKGFGNVLSNRYMVLIDTLGQLKVWDILAGKEIANHELNAEEGLISMHAIENEGRILVMPERYEAPNQVNTKDNTDHVTVHGVYCLSLEDGSIVWQRAFDSAWGCTISQPYRSPVLAFSRSRSIHEKNKPSRTQKMDVRLLNVADGKTIHEELDHELGPRNNGLVTQVLVRPLQSQIYLRIESENLVYSFGTPKPRLGGSGE